MDHMEICFESKLRAHGLAYVGFSRSRAETGISSVEPITLKNFKVGLYVIDEHKQF